MKYLYVIIISVYVLPFQTTEAQKISGQSKSVKLRVNAPSGKLLAVSQPVEMRIRQESVFSGISSPTELKLGQKPVVISNSPNEASNSSFSELERNSPKYYRLLIGVSDYSFNSPRLQDLNNPLIDVAQLDKVLTENFVFQSEYSTVLKNPSRQQIIQQLDKLAHEITPKDNLLIFYAGHGLWDEKIKIGYWLPADAREDDKSSWISNSTIRDYIAGISSKHTLLITDACFSGSIFKSREMDLSDYGMSNLYRLPSRKAMTSGTLTTVPDESKFMQYFLKRLNDTKGKYVSARQVFFGLETAVLNNTRTVPQFGVIQDTGDEGGDFIFIRK